MKKFTYSILAGILALTLNHSSAEAGKICAGAHFDGNPQRAQKFIDACLSEKVDAIILGGNYGHGKKIKKEFIADPKSSKEVISKFGNLDQAVYILTGNIDNPEDIKKISENYDNVIFLKDMEQKKIGDLYAFPLSGHYIKDILYKGAKYVSGTELERYIDMFNLTSKEDAILLTFINPKNDVDGTITKRGSASKAINTSQGNQRLESVLYYQGKSSLSFASDQKSAAVKKTGKTETIWKINPGRHAAIIEVYEGRIKDAKIVKY